MQKVRVYWNLHKNVWSIQDCKSGLVIDHKAWVVLEGNFVVREGGQKRVRQEGKKNVHAFVRGDATYFSPILLAHIDKDCQTLDNVMYNPYKYDSFVKVIDKTPVRKAKRAYLSLEPSTVLGDYVDMKPYIYAEGAEPC